MIWVINPAWFSKLIPQDAHSLCQLVQLLTVCVYSLKHCALLSIIMIIITALLLSWQTFHNIHFSISKKNWVFLFMFMWKNEIYQGEQVMSFCVHWQGVTSLWNLVTIVSHSIKSMSHVVYVICLMQSSYNRVYWFICIEQGCFRIFYRIGMTHLITCFNFV